MRRWLYRLVRAAPLAGTLIACLWIWQQNPFVQPLVGDSAETLRLHLERTLAREVDQEWLDRTMAEALEAGDLDRANMVAEAGAAQVPPLAPALPLAEAHAELERDSRDDAAVDCMACMVDAGACETLGQIGLCLVPFELTPAGDVNALRQEGLNWIRGKGVDEVNAGLAIVGLGATATILVTGGGSATAKAGATALRVARRIGSLTPRFAGELGDLGRIGLKPMGLLGYARGRAPLDAAVDTARLARLERVGADLTRVADNTSVPETLVMLRHVETSEDVARLARVSDAVGPETRKYLDLLGPRRVFGALVRLTDVALTAAVLFYAAGLQILVVLGNWLGRFGLRALAVVLRP